MFKKGILPSYPDSSELMNILVAISLNRLSRLHIPSQHPILFKVSYFVLEILGIPDNGRNRNIEYCKDLSTMVG